MTVNEPGVVARRQMTISHPLAAEWPRWLRMWWGQIQPPDLLLRIGAFPTLTRLPSPSLFPALALDALSRVNAFLGGSLPFLDTGATEATSPATPRLDYRQRRPRVQTAQAFTQLPDVHGDGEPHHAITQADHLQAIAHAPVELEHEPAAQDHGLAVENAHVNEEAQHVTRPEASLTPFQESEWEPLAHEAEHAPSLGEGVQHSEDWREAWSAVEFPQLTERGIGVHQTGLGRNVPAPMLGIGALARVMTSVLAEPTPNLLLPAVQNLDAALPNLDVPAGAAQLPEGLNAPGAQDVGMPATTVSRAGTAVRAADIAVRAARPLASEPAQLPGPMAGDVPVLPNVAETGAAHLVANQAQAGEHNPAQPFPTFAATEAMPAALALLTPQVSPLVGEVLHRQERAIESLSLIGHSPAPVEALELPFAGAASEHGGDLAQPLSGEHGLLTPAETQLAQHAQPAEMVVHTQRAEDATTALTDGTAPITPAHETLARETQAAPTHTELSYSADQTAQNLPTMVEDTSASRAIIASPPSLELRRPLTSVAPRMALNALQLPYFPARADDTGIASLLALPGLRPRHEITNIAAQAVDAREAFVNLTEHGGSFTAAEAERVVMPHTDEPALVAAAHTFAGFAPSLTSLARELPRGELTRGEHPLALRPLPDISHLLPMEHAADLGAQGGAQPPNLNLAHEPLAAPHMEVRRESPAASSLAQPQNGSQVSANWPWANEPAGGLPAEQHAGASAQPAALAAPETTEGGGDAGGVWQGGSATVAAPSAPLDVEAIARQVLGMLQSQLRAERDRHQIYDR